VGVVWPGEVFEPPRNWRWTDRWSYTAALLGLMRFVLCDFVLGGWWLALQVRIGLLACRKVTAAGALW